MNILIFIVGLLIYAGYGWAGMAYLAAAVLLSYGAGLLTKRFRWAALVCVGLNAAMLLLLKLQPVTGMSLLAPLGPYRPVCDRKQLWRPAHPAHQPGGCRCTAAAGL